MLSQEVTVECASEEQESKAKKKTGNIGNGTVTGEPGRGPLKAQPGVRPHWQRSVGERAPRIERIDCLINIYQGCWSIWIN